MGITVDQTTIATTIVKEIGRILSAGSKGELPRILGMKGVMTNDVMITMTAEMTAEMTIVSVMTAEMTAGMIGKGHRGHLGKKNRGLQKDPHLIMMTDSG